MTRPSWDARIARATELAKSYSFATEALSFYKEIATFQKDLYSRLETAGADCASWPDTLDPAPLLPWFPSFLLLVARIGPPELAEAAAALQRKGEQQWASLLSAYWGRNNGLSTDRFFAHAFWQPYAEHLAARRRIEFDRDRLPVCPVCKGKPQVGVLRPEGYGAKRSLICSRCSTEWDYRRIVCPACGQDVFDDLPVYTADGFEHVRVETCDRCQTYIKTVDLTKNGLAVPIVDELATIPLDLWAQEKGYMKLEPNLVGI